MTREQDYLDGLSGSGTALELGEKLISMGIKGKPGHSYDCPLSNVLSARFGGRYVISSGHYYVVGPLLYKYKPTAELPQAAKDFVQSFDSGIYPELVR